MRNHFNSPNVSISRLLLIVGALNERLQVDTFGRLRCSDVLVFRSA